MNGLKGFYRRGSLELLGLSEDHLQALIHPQMSSLSSPLQLLRAKLSPIAPRKRSPPKLYLARPPIFQGINIEMILLANRECWKAIGRIAILVIVILGGVHGKRPVEEIILLRLGEPLILDICVSDHALQNATQEGQRWQQSMEGGGREPTSAQHLVNINTHLQGTRRPWVRWEDCRMCGLCPGRP